MKFSVISKNHKITDVSFNSTFEKPEKRSKTEKRLKKSVFKNGGRA